MKPVRSKRASRRIWYASVLVVPLAVWAAAITWGERPARPERSAPTHVASGFQPPEMAAARYSTHDVIGDLGGMPVRIPSYFANYVEYDGDPGFGEKRIESTPVRTYASKIKSFGFHVRYPDMEGLKDASLRENKRSFPSAQSPWILVGLNAGRDFPGKGALQRRVKFSVERQQDIYPYENYEKLPALQFGMQVYAVKGLDPKSGAPYREGLFAHDVFVARNESGEVVAYIKCSNRRVASPPCQHQFSLEPKADVEVNVQYGRGMLENWRDIQSRIELLVVGFSIKN